MYLNMNREKLTQDVSWYPHCQHNCDPGNDHNAQRQQVSRNFPNWHTPFGLKGKKAYAELESKAKLELMKFYRHHECFHEKFKILHFLMITIKNFI